MWFTSYLKIRYEISFPLTLIFKIYENFINSDVTFPKTSNILENKSQVFERNDCTIT